MPPELQKHWLKTELWFPRYWRELKKELKGFKLNQFALFQTTASAFMGLSGFLETQASDGQSGYGTRDTGAYNTVRNGIWALSSSFVRACSKTQLGKDIAVTRANIVGAFAAAATTYRNFLKAFRKRTSLTPALLVRV